MTKDRNERPVGHIVAMRHGKAVKVYPTPRVKFSPEAVARALAKMEDK